MFHLVRVEVDELFPVRVEVNELFPAFNLFDGIKSRLIWLSIYIPQKFEKARDHNDNFSLWSHLSYIYAVQIVKIDPFQKKLL